MALGLGSGTTEDFISNEFKELNLKDKRLEKRARLIMNKLQSNLTSCIRRLFTDENQARQAYDFF